MNNATNVKTTAKLPQNVDVDTFTGVLFQWANTLTTSGQNMPFALPIRTDKTGNGFQMSLLRMRDRDFVSVGDLVASVEQESIGNVLYVRFFEGEGSGMDRQTAASTDVRERLKINLSGLVDIPLIMDTMRAAIPKAVAQSRT
ncbi:hypothetical protein WJX72_003642 [[Myrmecia] bisecta]|uniref:DUF7148 domain-containing protein n=1 Tax=[Myrmecia] bisecta TaxID=41462 RepID=A0AAW1PZQ6_9CHLO